MARKKILESKYYDSVLAGAATDSELEVVHWFNEPTEWITEEHTGTNSKEYLKKFEATRAKYEETLRSVEVQLEDEVSLKTFKWTINGLKDDVRIMRAIVNRAASELNREKTAKHCGIPVEKFYSRLTRLASFVIFVTGLVSGIYDLLDDSAPQWLTLVLFSIATVAGAVSSQLADRWAVRERRRRKLQKTVDQRDQIKTAKAFVDTLDFDESIIIAINRQRRLIAEKYHDSPKKAHKALEKLGRAIERKERKEDQSQQPRLVSQITPRILEEHAKRRRRIQRKLASEGLDDLEDTVIFCEDELE